MSINDWQILLLSALPITELRITIPMALTMGMSPIRAYFLAVAGNLLPILPLMLLLQPLSIILKHFPRLNNVFQRLLLKTRAKGKKVHKYGLLGLVLFVSIPFPGTGAWTGTTLAWLLGFGLYSTALAVSLGVFISGILVTLVSQGVIKVALLYDLEYIIVTLLIIVVIYSWYRKRRAGR